MNSFLASMDILPLRRAPCSILFRLCFSCASFSAFTSWAVAMSIPSVLTMSALISCQVVRATSSISF